eukprot:1444569-Rhodomonas_salina.2
MLLLAHYAPPGTDAAYGDTSWFLETGPYLPASDPVEVEVVVLDVEAGTNPPVLSYALATEPLELTRDILVPGRRRLLEQAATRYCCARLLRAMLPLTALCCYASLCPGRTGRRLTENLKVGYLLRALQYRCTHIPLRSLPLWSYARFSTARRLSPYAPFSTARHVSPYTLSSTARRLMPYALPSTPLHLFPYAPPSTALHSSPYALPSTALHLSRYSVSTYLPTLSPCPAVWHIDPPNERGAILQLSTKPPPFWSGGMLAEAVIVGVGGSGLLVSVLAGTDVSCAGAELGYAATGLLCDVRY